MELYILSKEDLSILSICKLSDYEINLDEETNAKSTFQLLKTEGLEKDNFLVLNGLYKQFLFVIDEVQREKGSNIATVTALDISNIFNRKVIEKNTDDMTAKSIEEFIANAISENFVNSDDAILNINYMDIFWHTNTQTKVSTNSENGLYNFHTFLTNCRQYKNVYTDIIVENIGEPQTAEGKNITIEAKSRKADNIELFGETSQEIREGYNLIQYSDIFRAGTSAAGITPTVNTDGSLQVVLEESNSNWHTAWWASSQTFTSIENELNEGDKFTIVFTIKKESGTIGRPTIYIKNGMGYYPMTGTVGTDFVEIYYTGTWKDTNSITPHLGWAGCVGTFTIKNWMIKKGEYASYQPYGVMPSPDYPSEIKNLEGKNKLEPKFKTNTTNGITLTFTDDGMVVSGNSTSQYQYFTIFEKELPAGTYTINGIIGSSYSTYTLSIAKNGTNLTYLMENNYTFTLTETATIKLNFYPYLTDYSTPKTFKYQLIEGDIVPNTYVPYNTIRFKVSNKNIFDKNSVITGKYYTANGVLDTFANGFCELLNIQENEKYSIKIDNNYSSTIRLNIFVHDKDMQRLAQIRWGDSLATNQSYTNQGYTMPSGAKYVTLSVLDLSPTAENINKVKIQIEKGSATSYIEHQEQIVYFPLSEGQKLYEGSYLADDGIHHVRGQVILNGNNNEGWSLASTNTNTCRFDIQALTNGLAVNRNKGLCSHFTMKYDNGTDTEHARTSGINFPTTFIIYINKTKASTVAELKTWLSNNPMTVEYELATEEIIPYNTAQQAAWEEIKNIMLYNGVNHISSDTNMVLKYYPLEPVGNKFVLRTDISYKEENTELIDTTLPEVTDYNKVDEDDITAKVQVYIREDGSEYNLYLKTDRTTTTDKNDPNRASGKIEVISVDTIDMAAEEALNVMKGNNYKHLVEFKIAKTSKVMDITKLHIGTPIRIKTEDDIYDSYISAITISDENFVYFKSGILRNTLIDKLKLSKDNAGDKLDKTGGIIRGNLNIVDGDLKMNGKIPLVIQKSVLTLQNPLTKTNQTLTDVDISKSKLILIHYTFQLGGNLYRNSVIRPTEGTDWYILNYLNDNVGYVRIDKANGIIEVSNYSSENFAVLGYMLIG